MKTINSLERRTLRNRLLAISVAMLISVAACGAGGGHQSATGARPATRPTSGASASPMIARADGVPADLPTIANTNDEVSVVAPTSTAPTRDQILTIPDLGFDLDVAELTPTATKILSGHLDQLRAIGGIEIDGHTDSAGTSQHNQVLSEARAAAVAVWLAAHGVSPTHITTRGFGATQPVAANDDLAGRAANRRVEIFSRP